MTETLSQNIPGLSRNVGDCENHFTVHREHVLYSRWRNMRERCYNPTHHKFDMYGGRGIKICDRWLGTDKLCGFCAFVTDIGLPQNPNLTIDRIDNDGNYEPGNCRWATSTTQNRNRRAKKINNSGKKGVYKRVSPSKTIFWVACIRYNGVNKFLGQFRDKDDAISARIKAETLYYT